MSTPSSSLRMCAPNAEPPMQASKWLKCQVLCDAEELQSLSQSLEPFEIYLTGCVTPLGSGSLAKQEFFSIYASYIEELKQGKIPGNSQYRHYFSSVFTRTPEVLYAIPLETNQQLIRVEKPVVQLQHHCLDYSKEDGKFRPMIFGTDCIHWGIQFSYPQIFQEARTHQILQVDDSPIFPNTSLFKHLQQWIRKNTIPTPFLVGDQQINVPMRLGKQCLCWINQHQQLINRGLRVKI